MFGRLYFESVANAKMGCVWCDVSMWISFFYFLIRRYLGQDGL